MLSHPRFWHKITLFGVLLSPLWLMAGRASAVDRTWDNDAGDFDFNNAMNWSSNLLPGSNDKAIINLAGDYTVTVTADKVIGALVVGGGTGVQTLSVNATLTINGTAGASSVAAGDVVTVGGTLNANAVAAALTVDGTLNANGTVATTGPLTINGTLNSSGTTTTTGTLTVASGGTLNLIGGTLNGASAQTIASGATMNWSGGTLGGTAVAQTTTIALGGTLNVNTASTRFFNMRTLTNNGTINWVGEGLVQADNGAILNNESGGVIDATFPNDSLFYWGVTGANPTVNNKSGATLKKRTNSGTLFLRDVNFSNSGTVDAQNGTINVAQASSGATGGTSTGTFNAASGAHVQFGGTPHTLNGATFTGAGSSDITASTVTVSGTVTVASGANLTLNGGTVTGAGNLQVNGTLNWSSGTMSGSGTTTIAATKTLNLLTGATRFLDGRTLTNSGTINWVNEGLVQADNGAILNNESGGVIDATFPNDCLFYWGTTGANPTINNKTGATLKKRTNSGTLFLRDVNFSNSGTVDAQNGTIDVAQASSGAPGGTSTGTFNAASGAHVQFGGTPHTLNGATFTGAGSSDNISSTITLAGTTTVASGGTFHLNGGITSGAGNLQVNGTLNWSAGTMGGSGTTTIAATKTLNLLTGATRFLDGRTLTNNGTINWVNEGLVQADNGAILNNESGGVIDATFPNDTIFYWGTAGANPTFNNKTGATLKKRTNSGTLFWRDVKLNDNGTVDVQTGTVELTQASSGGGLLTIGAGSTFSGAGLSRANGNDVVLSGAMTINSGARFEFTSGNLTGTGSINGAGSFNWIGGTMLNAGTTTVAVGATVNLVTGSTKFLNGHTLTNNGTINWTDTSNLQGDNGAILNNESGGVINVTFPINSVFYWGVSGANPTLNNKSGAILHKRTNNGTLELRDTLFTNNGTLDVQTGAVNLTVSSGGGSLTNFSGTTLTGGTYVIKGTFSFPGADIVTNAANITLDGAGSKLLNITTTGNALANFKTNAAAGKFTIQNGRNIVIAGATGDFSNAGIVTIGASSLFTVGGTGADYDQTGGTTDLTGGTLATTATGNVNISSGTLVGTGTVNSTVVNGGTVAPGHSPGIITINTNYTQSDTLAMEIGGTNAVTPDYDQLKVTGTVTLAGALSLSLINGYTPAFGDQFTLISNAGSDPVVGTFNGLAQGAPVTLGGKTFAISYTGGDGNDVTLTVAPALRINDVTVTEGNAGTVNATFKVTLSAASSRAITVNVATADGTATAPADYIAFGATPVSFAPGEVTKNVTVTVNTDTRDEPKQETFKVNLSSAVAAFIQDGQGIGTINDDDPAPVVSISDVTVVEGNTGSTVNAVFHVTLSAASGKTVTVTYKTADGTASALTDYVAIPSTVLTYLPGETTKDVTVVVNGDNADEGIETFKVVLQTASNAALPDTKGACSITDDDPLPSVAISDATVTEGDSGTKNVLFTVTLTGPTNRTVTVNYSTANGTAIAGSDYTTSSGTITFVPGTPTSKTLPIPVLGDTAPESTETFKVNLGVNGSSFATLSDAQGVATINDNDPAALSKPGDDPATDDASE